MSETDTQDLLCSISGPEDLRKLPLDKLPLLADQIRQVIVETLSETGGHLASSLGAVEIAIALHYVFNTPYDRICWDVGHQAYAHKLLTGRREQFATLRCHKGLSGFPKREESDYDVFSVGHAGTSISSAMGIAEALRLAGSDRKVIAVIGDGSLTSGLALEGLNQAGTLKERNLIVVLNDNEYSISMNVGAISAFLSRKMAGTTARAIRRRLKEFLTSIPGVGGKVFHIAQRSEDIFKAMVTPGILFEAFGFEYVGPLQGHNIRRLVETFEDVARLDNPVLVHAVTTKGRGYPPAEENPSAYHGIGPYVIDTGKPRPQPPAPPSYTSVFADTIVELADKDETIVGISAAMFEGTGLEKLAQKYPARSFDVGIAEGHGVTFAAGMAREGYKPVAAIYSTFLQRGYDQIVHDVALQNLPVIFALDRGGLVGADGPTHHGAFDLSYLRHIPRMIVMAPKDENELRHMLYSALQYNAPVAVRYPRGPGFGVAMDAELTLLEVGRGEVLREGDAVTLVGIGNMVHPCEKAAELLAEKNIAATVINARFVKPIDAELIAQWAKKTACLVTVEESVLQGGFGSAVLEAMAESGVAVRTKRLGLPDRFIEHGSQDALRKDLGLTPEGIAEAAQPLLTKS